MFSNFKFKIIYDIEKRINAWRNKLLDKKDKQFCEAHRLQDSNRGFGTKNKYNSFEYTRITLLEALYQKGYITPDSYIYDVGSGTGKAMIFFASKGVRNISGVEYQEKYYTLSKNNICKVEDRYNETTFTLSFGRAEKMDVSRDVDFIYMFNPFNSMEIYIEFLNKLKKSWESNKRNIRIALLYPTQKSKAAFESHGWIRPIDRVYDTNQPCHKCIYYQIYESGT